MIDEIEITKGISRRVRQRRAELTYTRKQLSEKAGVSGTWVEYLEGNKLKAPGLFAVARIAEALGVTLQWLMYGTE